MELRQTNAMCDAPERVRAVRSMVRVRAVRRRCVVRACYNCSCVVESQLAWMEGKGCSDEELTRGRCLWKGKRSARMSVGWMGDEGAQKARPKRVFHSYP